jgi:hypothetical protein
LYGLVIRIGFGRAPDGVYDLSEAGLGFDVSADILRNLYDEARKRDLNLPPRLNPDAVLTDEEVGHLRYHFDVLRSTNSVAVLYIRSTVFDSDLAETILSEVAQAINRCVILGSDQSRADLVRKGTGLTVGSLEARVRRALFASVNRGFSDGTNPT